MDRSVVATYSIAACHLDAGQWGVAVQSKFLAAASVVSFAEPEAGAVATQAYANPRYGPDGLALLREGASAEEAVRRLTEADDGRDHRQLGIVDREARSATFTGSECLDWAGGRPARTAGGGPARRPARRRLCRPLRRRRRPARRRPPDADRGAPPHLRDPRAAIRPDAEGRLATDRRRARTGGS